MVLRRALVLLVFGCLVPVASAPAAGRCGQHPWCDTGLGPDRRADLLLGAMTQDEKLGLLAADEIFVPFRSINSYGTDRYAHAAGIPRLDVPTIYFADGPVGVNRDKATLLPSPVALAATFDDRQARRYGALLGDEVKRTGHDVSLSPAVDIVRTPLAGRAFETYGEDPFLSSRITVGFIKGLQAQGVLADIKHFAMNNQEGQNGVPGLPITGTDGGRFLVDARVDDRTFHEIYLPMYDAAVKEADVASVMCAYNRVNGAKACENGWLLGDVLRRELGFDGFVLTDFNAALLDGAQALAAGTSLEMPWTFMFRPQLVAARLATGRNTQEQVDRALHRLLRTYFKHGVFDRAVHVNDRSTIDRVGHAKATGEIAVDGMVLLKNEDQVLPMRLGARDRTIAVIGASADRIVKGAGSGDVDPFSYVTPLAGLLTRAQRDGARVVYEDGSNLERAALAAREADVAIVFAFQASQEGEDLECMRLDCNGAQDALVRTVAEASRRTVAVLQTGSAVETPWLADTEAVLEAWYPGSDAGNAVAAVLAGDKDPGGRLPVTFPKTLGDTPASKDRSRYPGVGNVATYSERLGVGYRWYDAEQIAPRWPFGFGLSYTRFALRRPKVGRRLADGSINVGVTVANIGRRRGTEVVQVYVRRPSTAELPQAPRILAGTAKLSLRRGRAERVRIRLRRRAFESWDTTTRSWKLVPGRHVIEVGRSSRDLRTAGRIRIHAPRGQP